MSTLWIAPKPNSQVCISINKTVEVSFWSVQWFPVVMTFSELQIQEKKNFIYTIYMLKSSKQSKQLKKETVSQREMEDTRRSYIYPSSLSFSTFQLFPNCVALTSVPLGKDRSSSRWSLKFPHMPCIYKWKRTIYKWKNPHILSTIFFISFPNDFLLVVCEMTWPNHHHNNQSRARHFRRTH